MAKCGKWIANVKLSWLHVFQCLMLWKQSVKWTFFKFSQFINTKLYTSWNQLAPFPPYKYSMQEMTKPIRALEYFWTKFCSLSWSVSVTWCTQRRAQSNWRSVQFTNYYIWLEKQTSQIILLLWSFYLI